MREWLGDRPWHWWIPMPAVLVSLLVFLFSHRIWTEELTVNGRYGGTSQVLASHHYAFILAMTSGGYWATYFVGSFLPIFSIGLRTPTETEVGCVAALLRILCAVALYAYTTRLVVQYIMHA